MTEEQAEQIEAPQEATAAASPEDWRTEVLQAEIDRYKAFVQGISIGMNEHGGIVDAYTMHGGLPPTNEPDEAATQLELVERGKSYAYMMLKGGLLKDAEERRLIRLILGSIPQGRIALQTVGLPWIEETNFHFGFSERLNDGGRALELNKALRDLVELTRDKYRPAEPAEETQPEAPRKSPEFEANRAALRAEVARMREEENRP